MKYFDPSECIRGIQQLLVSDKKRIAFLFGAGTSFSKKNDRSPNIPAVKKMTAEIAEKIREKAEFQVVIDEIKEELENENKEFTIESLLSNIEEKIRIIGRGQLNGLSREKFEELDTFIRDRIRTYVSIHKSITSDLFESMAQCDFASWIRNADRKYAVEIFTTNYDYLIEIGLEQNNVPYYDGFTGSYHPFFNADSLEDLDFLIQETKLWKIHGSLGLHRNADSGKIIRSNSDSEDLLIYPSSTKYSNSKKQPYAAFMDRLHAFLKRDDAVLFTCGYSFGDEHINERILSALKTNTSAHVFALNYDVVWDDKNKSYQFTENSNLAKLAQSCRKISILSSRNAVIGSKYGTWRLKREPDKEDTLNIEWYFDEDAPIKGDAPIGKEQNGNELWMGTGELTIVDFVKFTNFLHQMIPKSDWEEKKDD